MRRKKKRMEPTAHHVALLDVGTLVQQQLAAGEMPCREKRRRYNYIKYFHLRERAFVRLDASKTIQRRNAPLPAANNRGGSPQWSDSFKGAPCRSTERDHQMPGPGPSCTGVLLAAS